MPRRTIPSPKNPLPFPQLSLLIAALLLLVTGSPAIAQSGSPDCTDKPFPLDWTEEVIDGDLPYRCIYIYPGDIDGDGKKDIVTGGWWYKNPGNPKDKWDRNTVGGEFKNMSLILDIDDDGDLDLFGTQGEYEGSDMVWAENDGSGNFTVYTNIPAGKNTFTEPFMAGAVSGNFTSSSNLQIAINWNGAESSNDPVQLLTIPDQPDKKTWTLEDISPNSLGEDLGKWDIDGDGALDLFQSGNWLRNRGPGINFRTFQTEIPKGSTFDRNAIADLDGDGKPEAVICQIGSNLPIYFAEPGDDPRQPWNASIIDNDIDGGLSLDLADMDEDGDLDILVGEWQGAYRLMAFENRLCENQGWQRHILHVGVDGKDHHDGAIATDIDDDGDLDILSIGWQQDKNIPRIYINNSVSALLPIDLARFELVRLSSNVKLTWRTLSEANNSGFVVERSADGLRWDELAWLDGAGQSTRPRDYSYHDARPLPGTSYYRLKQLDYDGSFTYSPIRSVEGSSNAAPVLFPNPARDRVTVQSVGDDWLRAFNAQGRQVLEQPLRPGPNAIDLSALPSGVYLFRWGSGPTQRVVKE